jgi:chromodomain-helicase-DNA-binding protein 1
MATQERVKFHVLLTSFELLSKHLPDIRRLSFAALVVDEAHRLKSAGSKLFQVCVMCVA